MSKYNIEDLKAPLLHVPKAKPSTDDDMQESSTHHLISSGIQTISSTLIVITIWGNLKLVRINPMIIIR
jgi:hypothetical protein